MKVCITAQGTDMEAEVDPRFGRAQQFIVADTETGASEAHDNSQNLNAMQGAGVQAAQNVADLGVEALVTGNVGPKAFAALNAAGIKIYVGASGTVRDALAQFRAGQLQSASQASVEGHWA